MNWLIRLVSNPKARAAAQYFGPKLWAWWKARRAKKAEEKAAQYTGTTGAGPIMIVPPPDYADDAQFMAALKLADDPAEVEMVMHEREAAIERRERAVVEASGMIAPADHLFDCGCGGIGCQVHLLPCCTCDRPPSEHPQRLAEASGMVVEEKGLELAEDPERREREEKLRGMN
jgi:hypothetical protein